LARLGQDAKTGVVGRQRQSTPPLVVIPADPLIARPNVVSRRRPTQQRQPLAPMLDDVTQTLADQVGVLEVVMLADQLVPACLLVRLNQPHDDLIQHGGFRSVREFDALVLHPKSKTN
jgi:hypothetical protein